MKFFNSIVVRIVSLSLVLNIATWISNGHIASALDGAEKVEFLLNALESSKDYKVRIAAAEELGKIADGTLADWMVRQFRKEENSAVRLSILYAIAQIPDHRILPPLLEVVRQEILTDKEFLAIQRILWNFREAIQITTWESALTSAKDTFERSTAAWILGVVAAKSSFAALRYASGDPIAYLRMRVAQGLALYRSQEGRPVCERLSKDDPDAKVRSAAQNCVAILDLAQKRGVSADRDHRVNLKIDLYGLEVQSVTPQTFSKYLKRNVNPRELNAAVASLARVSEAEARYDRTIEIVRDEQLRETFRLDASMITKHVIHFVDLKQMREVIRNEAGNIQGCYREVLKHDPKAGGEIVARFKVTDTGRVSEIKVSSPTFKDKNMLACLTKQLAALQFSRLGISYVMMNYTFSFSPPRDQRFEF